MPYKFSLLFLLVFSQNLFATNCKKIVEIVLLPKSHSRIIYGAQYLQKKINALGYETIIVTKKNTAISGTSVKSILVYTSPNNGSLKKEGYTISSSKDYINVIGSDASGTLYGCLELANIIEKTKIIPDSFNIKDAPEMALRGQCIGLQKPYYLPGRNVYEYPYTPETFPWFYDKKLWIQILDSMVENRMNSLYLWNGHPFASLVKLKEYPYAVEVDNKTFKINQDLYSFLTKEADKRGIWIIQMFYNIIVSKPFAEKNNLKTQERERNIIPIISNYTKKSITAFIQKYPNVGLLITLGEAMEGVGHDDIEWFTKTIIPGVKDGMKLLGRKEEPPIILRAHDTDAPSVLKEALPLYKNLYTMAKFNGEALTYETPRGTWAQLHKTLSSQGSVHIANIHILANLEPFRYAAAEFIQKSVIGMHNVLYANGLHLYPESSFWDWPYTADSIRDGKRLLQIQRDWLWYKMWSRYAWNANRNVNDEINYWSAEVASQFGTDINNGKYIIKAYNEAGEIAPKLLRRFGITDGNRQTLTLGMLMTQLINPYRYGLFTLLYESEAPEGESLAEYAQKEWLKIPHHGETPPVVINAVKKHGDEAVNAIDSASHSVNKNMEEFNRIKNDIYAYRELAYHYANKADAALFVLKYKNSNNLKDLDSSLHYLKASVNDYKRLVALTKPAYLYANSMQTQQRKIPMRGINGAYKNWYEVLIPFEQELKIFEYKLDSLKNKPVESHSKIEILKNANVKIKNISNNYTIDLLSEIFTDTSLKIKSYLPELQGLNGIKMSFKNQIKEGTLISFENKKPVKVLVGFFEPQKAAFTRDSIFLKSPELETNALANDYGQADRKIANAIVISGMPQLHIHSYDFNAGNNTLKLEKGIALVLGFIDADSPLRTYDAGLYESGNQKNVDWLFE